MASHEWEEMFTASMESVRERLVPGEATPWGLIATDSEGTYYLLQLNGASPYFVQRLLVQTLIKLQEWIDRHPPDRIVEVPLDPQGGPKE